MQNKRHRKIIDYKQTLKAIQVRMISAYVKDADSLWLDLSTIIDG